MFKLPPEADPQEGAALDSEAIEGVWAEMSKHAAKQKRSRPPRTTFGQLGRRVLTAVAGFYAAIYAVPAQAKAFGAERALSFPRP